MAKSPKSRTAAASVRVPQTMQEAAEFVRDIGVAERAVARIEHDMNDAITAIKANAEAAALVHLAGQKALTQGLQMFCDANRQALTDGGKVKHHEFGTGRVEWRLKPAKVTFAKGATTDTVLRWVMGEGDAFADFVSTKYSLDRDAMRSDPERAEQIPGVTIASDGEQFAVAPFEAQIEGGKS